MKRWRREAKLHQWLIQGLGNTGFGRSSPRSQVHLFSLELNLQYPAPTTCNHLAAIRAGTTCLGADRGCTAWGQDWTYDRVQIASSADGPWPRVTGRVVCILWSVRHALAAQLHSHTSRRAQGGGHFSSDNVMLKSRASEQKWKVLGYWASQAVASYTRPTKEMMQQLATSNRDDQEGQDGDARVSASVVPSRHSRGRLLCMLWARS